MRAAERPILVVVAGLPGSGKSTVASGIAKWLKCTQLSVDTIEAAMWRSGVKRSHNSGIAAYEVAAAIAADQISSGRDVVIDAVNDSAPARNTWPPVAKKHPNGCLAVLLTRIDDQSVHRARVERREALPGFYVPTWNDVVERARRYPEWPEATVIDTSAPLAVTMAAATTAIDRVRRAVAS